MNWCFKQLFWLITVSSIANNVRYSWWWSLMIAYLRCWLQDTKNYHNGGIKKIQVNFLKQVFIIRYREEFQHFPYRKYQDKLWTCHSILNNFQTQSWSIPSPQTILHQIPFLNKRLPQGTNHVFYLAVWTAQIKARLCFNLLWNFTASFQSLTAVSDFPGHWGLVGCGQSWG